MAEGTFLANYKSTGVGLGGYQLELNLVVDAANKTAGGSATVTNGSVNPAVNVKLPVSGPVVDMTVMNPTTTHHLLVLNSPSMLGRNLEVRLVTQPDWQSGEASVTLFLDTPAGTIHFTDKMEIIKKTAV